jgi:hypothetical protein
VLIFAIVSLCFYTILSPILTGAATALIIEALDHALGKKVGYLFPLECSRMQAISSQGEMA